MAVVPRTTALRLSAPARLRQGSEGSDRPGRFWSLLTLVERRSRQDGRVTKRMRKSQANVGRALLAGASSIGMAGTGRTRLLRNAVLAQNGPVQDARAISGDFNRAVSSVVRRQPKR